jgi:hypothetical protein
MRKMLAKRRSDDLGPEYDLASLKGGFGASTTSRPVPVRTWSSWIPTWRVHSPTACR